MIKDAENDPIKRARLISEIVKTIAVIPDSIVRSVYLRECSKLMDIEEKILYDETYKIRRTKYQEQERRYKPTQPQNASVQQSGEIVLNLGHEFKHEYDIMRVLLNFETANY